MSFSHQNATEKSSTSFSSFVAIVSAFGLGAALTLAVNWYRDSSPRTVPNFDEASSSQAQLGSNAPVPSFAPPIRPLRSASPPNLPTAGIPSMTGEAAPSEGLMLELDQRFRSEEVDRQWASAHEEAIINAIAGNEHDGFNVPDPKTIDIGCRRSMCRVRMTYDYEDDAAQMQTRMILGMPPEVSVSRTFLSPSSSGGIEMVMYAGNVGAPR